ncbi:efflux RND transporter permease subunit [Vallitalea guaymasensis]|uniref:efflux RND transporter permease subunit n=1 Tax=Vallitalea guaymasensis TaxID=1185412 RepID=UPI0023552F9C|nr:efflux RND transporter permease subunit [Vallitalea guaymasensis]
MGKIIRYAIKERKTTILLAIILIIYGLYNYYLLPKQENPDTTSPAAVVTVVFPGASAKEVEEQVTKLIEEEAMTLDGIDSIESISNNNVSIVIVKLTTGIDSSEQWDNLREAMYGMESKLPLGADKPVVETDLIDSAGFIISLSSKELAYDELSSHGEDIRKKLIKVDGVKKVVIDGLKEKQVVIEVDYKALNTYSLSIEDIYNLLVSQNLNIPSGYVETDKGKITVSTPGKYQSLKDIEDLIITISPETGGIVRLKNIAEVDIVRKENVRQYTHEGEEAVLLTGYFEENKNIVNIGKDVKDIINNYKDSSNELLKIDEVLFQPEEVEKSVNNFIISLLEGMLFVLLVVLIGVGIRNALIVATSIPLSICITFIVMKLLGIDIQQMSISGLIVALGILVDNSIVISDAIQVKLNEGNSKKESAYLGAREQLVPVLTSTLTTLAAFAAITVLPGAAGEFVQSLPQVVFISLTASFIVAMLVTPALASLFFKEHSQDKKNRKNIIRKFFKGFLKVGLKHKITTIAISLGVLVLSILAVFTLDIDLFPYADKDIMYINVKGEVKGDISKTKELVKEVEKVLEQEKDITTYTSAIGGSMPKFYITVNSLASTEDIGQVLFRVNLKKTDTHKNQNDFSLYLQNKLNSVLQNGIATVGRLELTESGSDFKVIIAGEDTERMASIAQEIEKELLNKEGTVNVSTNMLSKEYEYKVDIDSNAAASYGLTKYDIQKQLNLSLYGSIPTTANLGNKNYQVYLKTNAKEIRDINNLAIKSNITGEKVLLKQVANIQLQENLPAINRLDGEEAIIVQCDVISGYSIVDIGNTVESMVDNNMNTAGLNIKYYGQKQTMDTYLDGLDLAAIFSIAVIYIILLLQFNSFKQPLVILLTVPLSLIGSILILVLLDIKVTFTVLLGVISLIGIVVNNAILLIEYINRARDKGASLIEACIDSVDKRFRPIMLSTVTTVIGLVPLALSGSSFFSPMAIALMGGLMISTILTLVIIPVVYTLVEKTKK